MPFDLFKKRQQEEEEAAQPGQTQATGSGGSSVVSPSGSAGSGPSVSRAPSKPAGGGWVGLEKYLDNNRGEGARMASQVTAPLGQKRGEVTSGLSNLEEQFGKQVKAGTVNALPTPPATGGYTPPKSPDRLLEGGDPYATMTGKTYTGPGKLSEVEGYDDLYKQAESTQAEVDLSKSPQGRGALLQKTYTQATPGGNRLNTHLAGDYITKELKGWDGLTKMLDDADGKSVGTANTARTESTTNAGTWKAGPPPPPAPKPLTVAEEVAYFRAEDARLAEQERAKSRKLDQDQRTRRLSAEERAAQYGLTLEQWVAAGKPDLSKATAQDLERWKSPPITTTSSPGLKGTGGR